MTDQKFFAVLANVEAREEPRQSLQDGDKALETLRASRPDIRRATTARITDLNGRSFTDEPCARHPCSWYRRDSL